MFTGNGGGRVANGNTTLKSNLPKQPIWNLR
jgi:hypothetical protein